MCKRQESGTKRIDPFIPQSSEYKVPERPRFETKLTDITFIVLNLFVYLRVGRQKGGRDTLPSDLVVIVLTHYKTTGSIFFNSLKIYVYL